MASEKFSVAVLLSWLAFPIYVWQGVSVRMRTERLLPAKGTVRGALAGSEPATACSCSAISAAAVGVDSTTEGFRAAACGHSPCAQRTRRHMARGRLQFRDGGRDPRPCRAEPAA